jgi:YVTN family beta-propeller protein
MSLETPRLVGTFAVVILLTGSLQGCGKLQAAQSTAERVFVSNEDSGDVSVLDAASGRTLATIPVGKRPRGLRVGADGKHVYVALSGSPKGGPGVDERQLPPPDRSADGIGVIDVDARRLLRILPSGADPEAFDLAGNTLLISNEDAAQASVVELGSGKLVTSIDVGGEPEGVSVHPNGRFAYVTSEADDAIWVIDTASRRVSTQIAVGKRPRAVAFTPDGSRAYVTNELGGSVSVLDARSHLLERTVSLQTGSGALKPMGVVVAPDAEHVYVTTGRGGSVIELETRGNSVSRTLRDVGKRPWGIGVTKDGRSLYVANGPSDDVALVDVAEWRVSRRIPVGRSPWGIAVGPHAGR